MMAPPLGQRGLEILATRHKPSTWTRGGSLNRLFIAFLQSPGGNVRGYSVTHVFVEHRPDIR